MIPKLIHHIWIGTKPFPEEFSDFVSKWKILYPDFNFIFWDNNLVNESKIIDESISEYYYGDYKIAFKVDLLRFKILERYGGLYVDTDTEPLKRMPDEFFELNFFSGREKPQPQVAIGIMGSEVKNQLVNDYNTNVLHNVKQNLSTGIENVAKITGPEYFDTLCTKYITTSGYKFFDSNYFYPYGWNELHRRYENFKETCPDAYSVHHWAHSWW